MSTWIPQTRARLPRFAETAAERARLTVVPRRRTPAPRVPFVVLVAIVLLGGVVGLLMFNTSMQQRSFQATALQGQAAALQAKEQQLQMELDQLRDPQRVASRAQRLGMVPVANPAFLRLDGVVLGEPAPASSLNRQRITPLPTRRPAGFAPPPQTAQEPSEIDSLPGADTAGGVASPDPGAQEGTNEDPAAPLTTQR